MPDMIGVEPRRQLARLLLPTMVVVLTVYEEPVYLNQVLRVGSRGYVLEQSADEELVWALRSVGSGLYLDEPS